MKIGLAQINTTVGDFAGNAAAIERVARHAAASAVDLLVFPELTVTGYSPRDLVELPHFVEKTQDAIGHLLAVSKQVALLIGTVAKNPRRGEKPLHNAAILLADGDVQWQYAKHLLPTYDVFDEGRYFAAGRELGFLKLKGRKLGITICEDIWNDQEFWEHPHYHMDPVTELVNGGADAIITLSASPFGWEKESVRMEMLQFMARRHQVPLFYCNLIGGNDDLVFEGRSVVLNRAGSIVAEAKSFEEDLLIVDDEAMEKRQEEVKPRDLDETIFNALGLGVRDYASKCGFKDVVLGLSGGIDSSLTAVIAAEALGPEHVLGVLMPSPYSSPESVEDALSLAKNLGIRTETIPIEGTMAAYDDILGPVFAGHDKNVTEENIQARIRGNILMALSNKLGHLVLSTGNKSEIAVGYCTLYGDMSGGLAVLSDVPKTRVISLSRWINRSSIVIPEGVLSKPPSAELRPDQTDQDSLPPYEVLDGILKLYVEDHLDRGEIIARGFVSQDVDDVLDRVARNEYKRTQMPIGIKIGKRAFGMGRRFPIAKKGF